MSEFRAGADPVHPVGVKALCVDVEAMIGTTVAACFNDFETCREYARGFPKKENYFDGVPTVHDFRKFAIAALDRCIELLREAEGAENKKSLPS